MIPCDVVLPEAEVTAASEESDDLALSPGFSSQFQASKAATKSLGRPRDEAVKICMGVVSHI